MSRSIPIVKISYPRVKNAQANVSTMTTLNKKLYELILKINYVCNAFYFATDKSRQSQAPSFTEKLKNAIAENKVTKEEIDNFISEIERAKSIIPNHILREFEEFKNLYNQTFKK